MNKKNLWILIVLVIIGAITLLGNAYINQQKEPLHTNEINLTNSSNITNNTTASKNIVKSDNTKKSDNPIVGYLGDGTPVYKSDYAKLSKEQPIYNFNPNNPDEMRKVEAWYDGYERGYDAGVSDSQSHPEPTPTPSGGSVNMSMA